MAENNNITEQGMGISFSSGKPVRDNPSLLTLDKEEAKPQNSVYCDKLTDDGEKSGSVYLDTLVNNKQDVKDIKEIDTKKMSPKDKKIITVLAVLNVLVFAFIGIYIYATGGNDAYDLSDDTPDIISYKPENTFNAELDTYIKNVDFPQDIQFYFKRLYSENQDTIGWIRLDGTGIDYPVLKAEDNKKYERANFYGEYDRRGSIFMDYRNTVGKSRGSLSKVTILWGHHLTEDATIFAELEGYMNVDFYKEHPVIEMNTLYEDYKWKVFACFTAAVNEEDETGGIFYYWDPYITDDDTQGFVNECLTRSWFINPDVDIKSTDKILCLSTCTYILNKYSYHEIRCVVMARLVRQGESDTVEVSNAYQNTNHRMPQLYYDINSMVNPFAQVACWQAGN